MTLAREFLDTVARHFGDRSTDQTRALYDRHADEGLLLYANSIKNWNSESIFPLLLEDSSLLCATSGHSWVMFVDFSMIFVVETEDHPFAYGLIEPNSFMEWLPVLLEMDPEFKHSSDFILKNKHLIPGALR